MKKNLVNNKYPIIDKLPNNALTVREYAEQEGITTAWIYKQIREKKAPFKIVVFQQINFILPN